MISMGITMEGDGEFRDTLRQLDELGSKFSGVQLLGRRLDGIDADIIVETLAERDRDFFSSDEQLSEEVAQSFANEVEKHIGSAERSGRERPDENALAASALMAAMKAYMRAVVGRLEAQRTANGGAPKQLTPQYAAAKKRRYGFETPIGKASGQLLQSLIPGGSGAGKIKLTQ